jgi:hypothetical protein
MRTSIAVWLDGCKHQWVERTQVTVKLDTGLLASLPAWQRAIIIATMVIPLLVVVLMSAPVWFIWPFLDAGRRTAVLQFLDRLVAWVKAVAAIK